MTTVAIPPLPGLRSALGPNGSSRASNGAPWPESRLRPLGGFQVVPPVALALARLGAAWTATGRPALRIVSALRPLIEQSARHDRWMAWVSAGSPPPSSPLYHKGRMGTEAAPPPGFDLLGSGFAVRLDLHGSGIVTDEALALLADTAEAAGLRCPGSILGVFHTSSEHLILLPPDLEQASTNILPYCLDLRRKSGLGALPAESIRGRLVPAQIQGAMACALTGIVPPHTSPRLAYAWALCVVHAALGDTLTLDLLTARTDGERRLALTAWMLAHLTGLGNVPEWPEDCRPDADALVAVVARLGIGAGLVRDLLPDGGDTDGPTPR